MVDLAPQIGQMRSAINGQQNIGDMTMDIEVERQQTERAYSTPQALVADIILEGHRECDRAARIGNRPRATGSLGPDHINSATYGHVGRQRP